MNLIERFMKERGWNDTEMAAALGVSQPFITRLRRNERRPSPAMAVRLENLTGIPASDFVFEERHEPPQDEVAA